MDSQSIQIYIQTLKDFGLSNEEVFTFSALLHDFIDEYVFNKSLKLFSDVEIKALDLTATREGFSKEQKLLMIQLAYEEKSGKSIQKEIDDIVLEFSNILKESQNKSKKIIADFKSSSEEEHMKKLQEIISDSYDDVE